MYKKLILTYLNYTGEPDEKTARLIDLCAKEVEEKARFSFVYRKYTLTHHPLMIKELGLLLESEDLREYLSLCGGCIVMACTLGYDIDKHLRYLQHTDMAKAVVFDRAAGRYLEYMCDEKEKEIIKGPHTFRFAPGYGDIPLSLNRSLSRALSADKTLGLSVTEGGTFLPFKSMLGITGLGVKKEKSCMSCIKKDSCSLRKEGLRCYVTD